MGPSLTVHGRLPQLSTTVSIMETPLYIRPPGSRLHSLEGDRVGSANLRAAPLHSTTLHFSSSLGLRMSTGP